MGESRARSILSGFLTSVSFRVNDAGSKEFIKKLHGVNRKKEVYMASVQGRGIVENVRDANVVEDWISPGWVLGRRSSGFREKNLFYFSLRRHRKEGTEYG